jgi:WD40 repeat protein
VPERKLLTALHEPRAVNSVAVSPDGRLVAYGTFENVVKVVELPGGKEACRCAAERGAAVAFSPEGKLLAIATHPRLIELWEVGPWRRRNVEFAGNLSPWVLLSVAFSRDGSKVAAGGGIFPPKAISGQAAVWDVITGRLEMAVKADAAIMHVEFSPDGRHLATACLDTKATLWELSSGKEYRSYRDPEAGLVRVHFLNGGETIATLGPRSGVKLFKRSSATAHARMRFDNYLVEAVSVTADSRLIASGGADCVVRLWHAQTQEHLAVLGPSSDDPRHRLVARREVGGLGSCRRGHCGARWPGGIRAHASRPSRASNRAGVPQGGSNAHFR